MKKFLLILLAAAANVQADALNPRFAPANTRWLLHLDGDAFRKSRIGAMIVEDKLESHIRKLERDTAHDFNFSFHKISALTAFGAKVGEGADKEGVLLIQTTADVRPDLEKLIAIKEGNPSGEPPISKITEEGVEFFTVGQDLNVAQAGPNTWILGKSRPSVRAARAVVLGQAASLNDPDFLKYPTVTNSFFFLAVADTGSAKALPAQAKILQKAEGGRVVIGEQNDRLFLNLALRSRDAEAIAQIQQVAQGLIAFAALTQPDNKDLQALSSSASVKAEGDLVSVNLSFPLNRALEKVREGKD